MLIFSWTPSYRFPVSTIANFVRAGERADLQRMAAWLKSCGIETVAMQSTGVYWFAVYDVLEKHGFRAGGSVLEAGMGIGNFFMMMPEDRWNPGKPTKSVRGA
jgi:hypothetical protein